MHEIFISYSSNHRDLTRDLAAVLEQQYGKKSVWWDQALEARGPYNEQIEVALNNARVVVVIWSRGAAESRWVYSEAVRARELGKLVNVRPSDLSGAVIPMPFNTEQFAPLEKQDPILRAIGSVWRGVPGPTRIPLYLLFERNYRRSLLDPKQKSLPRDLREIAPSELLQAKYGVVPFVDVTGMAAELGKWCTGLPRPSAGCLVHGPGGLGKTRLLIDVAAQLREQGWMAGFLDRPDELDDKARQDGWQALEQLIDHGEDAGLLLILDYAEGRQDELIRLCRRLADRPENATRKIRLVLLARSAGEWWERLVDEQPELVRIVRGADGLPNVTELPAIRQSEERRGLFEAARDAFTPVLAAQGYATPSGEPSPERVQRLATNDDLKRPLAVQMEALLWLASVVPASGSTGTDKLLDRVLGLERAHWRKLLVDLDGNGVRDLARGVGQVTLVQGVDSRSSVERLLMCDLFYADRTSRAAVDPLVNRLRRLYHRTDGIAQLEPDLIGEHHVAADLVGDAELVAGCLAWIAALPEADRPQRRRDLLTVLQRTTHRVHGARTVGRAEAMLDIIIAKHVDTFAAELVAVVIDTPGNLAQLLDSRIDGLDEAALAAVDDHLPLQSLSLMDLSLRVAARRASLARALITAIDEMPNATVELREGARAHLGVLVGNLSNRLSSLGQREEALVASQEAVEIYRQLAAARPEAFLPNLAGSLNNLGGDLSNLGRREEALAASQEAVEIYRQLAAARPDVFLPDLATSASTTGAMYSALGRLEEALAASREAVDLYRQLAAARPDTYRPDLARSLIIAGAAFSNLGRREEALAASREAVDLYRQLAAARADSFRPDLAGSLTNLGEDLSALGQREEALSAGQEAVEIYRQLAAGQPEAFLPAFAGCLSNTGSLLSALGRREEALAAGQEAVAIHRRLAAAHLDIFLPDLASSVNNLSTCLSALGRSEEALEAGQEAADIYRQLVLARPDVFLPDLAKCLQNNSVLLFALRLPKEALAASLEAVKIFRPLVTAHPDAFSPNLARSLSVLGIRFAVLGRPDEALAAFQEAVSMQRQLAAARPDAFLPDLGGSLNNIGRMLSAIGRLDEALAANQEAVDIHRRLAAAHPDTFFPDLATSLGSLSQVLAALGRSAGAAEAAGEGLAVLAPLVERHPAVFGRMAQALGSELIAHSKAARIVPDIALLQRIARALGDGGGS